MKFIDDSDVSVVVSGPVYPEMTWKCFKSIREVMPGAEIVFSTWKGESTRTLDFDILVLNDDPGNIKMINRGGERAFNNMNRQIVSTQTGIAHSTRKYILKMRSDTLMESFLKKDLINEYNKNYDLEWHFLKKRIVTVKSGREVMGRRYVFALCDWYFFGIREDIWALWDIPLLTDETFFFGPKIKNMYSYDYNMHEENYLMCKFCEKYTNIDYFHEDKEKICMQYRKVLANNFIVVDTKMFGCQSLKYPRRLRSDVNLSEYVYGYSDWLELYNLYANGKQKKMRLDRVRILRFISRMRRWIFKRPYISEGWN